MNPPLQSLKMCILSKAQGIPSSFSGDSGIHTLKTHAVGMGGGGTHFSVFKMRFQGRRHTPAVVFTCVYVCYDSRADAAFQVLASSPQSCLWLERKHISNTHFAFLLVFKYLFEVYMTLFFFGGVLSFIILQSCYSGRLSLWV